MKLKLPLTLLASLLACITPLAHAATLENPSDPKGGVVNPNGSSNYYTNQDIVWTKDHSYDMHGPSTYLSIGYHEGDGSLRLKEGADVLIANCLNIGGPGYQYSKILETMDSPPPLQPHTGYVYVGKDSILEVGAHPDQVDAAGSQLHVGSGGKGTLEVDGGTVITNYLLNVGYSAYGMLSVKDGTVEVRLPKNIVDSFGTKGGATSSNFYNGNGKGSEGFVILDNSTLKLSASGTRYGQTYLSMYGGNSTFELRNGSYAELGAIAVLGYGGGSAIMTVDSGSRAIVNGVIYASFSAGSDSTINIKGEGSLLKSTGLNVNDIAKVTVQEGGTLDCGKLNNSGTLDITADGGNIILVSVTNTGKATFNLTNGSMLNIGTPVSRARAATSSSIDNVKFNIDSSSGIQAFTETTVTNSVFNITMDDLTKPAIVMQEGNTLHWGSENGGAPNEVHINLTKDALAQSSTKQEIVVVDGDTNFDDGGSDHVDIYNTTHRFDADNTKEEKVASDKLVITFELNNEASAAAQKEFAIAGEGVANALHSSVSAVQGLGAAALNQLNYRPAQDERFWVQGLGRFERAGSSGATPGYHYNGGGYAVGYDREVAERLILGVALGQQFGVNKTRMEETRVRQHATMGTLYGRYSYNCPRGCTTRVIDAYASYGNVRNRGRSSLLGEGATGRWNDDVYNIGGRMGWQMPLTEDKSWMLTPFIGLEYSYASQGNAHMVSANYTRLYHDGSMQVWSVPVGITLQGKYAVTDSNYLLPELTLAYAGDISRKNPKVHTTVLGSDTAYYGVDPGDHAFRLQTGTRYTLTESATLGLFYELEIRSHECDQNVTASISISF